MNEIIVVTFKVPADAWIKKMYGDDVEFIYDSTAFHDDSLSQIEIKKLRRKYSDVETFKCTLADYDSFVDNESAYEEFVRTGVCPLKPIQEDVDVGTESRTVNITCNLRIERTNPDSSFDYNIDTDDVGQIVFTPYDTGTRFCHEGEDVVEGENVKFETVELTAHMISDVDDYDYFMGTDDIGQFVITPIAEETSFLSASINNSLNLVTEDKSIDEDLSDVDKLDIVNKVMSGEISVFSDDGEPEKDMIHIEELDSIQGQLKFEYYYDEESNSVVSYSRPVRAV